MNVQQNFEMRWNALEVIDRRQVEGRDEALEWIYQESGAKRPNHGKPA